MSEQKRAAVMIVYSEGTTEMPPPRHLADDPAVRDAVGTYGVRNRRKAEQLAESDPRFKSVIVASSETRGQAVFAGDELTEAQLGAVALEYLTRHDATLAEEVASLGDDSFGPSTVLAQDPPTTAVGSHWWYQLAPADLRGHQMADPVAGVGKPLGWSPQCEECAILVLLPWCCSLGSSTKIAPRGPGFFPLGTRGT